MAMAKPEQQPVVKSGAKKPMGLDEVRRLQRGCMSHADILKLAAEQGRSLHSKAAKALGLKT